MKGYIQCSTFRARTTRVSNPVCSPSFRASASVMVQEAAFAAGVPPDIYAFHRYTGNSTSLSHPRARQFRATAPGLSPGISRPTYRTAYTPFTPSNSEQRSPPTYYRGCWHVVGRGFFHRYHQNALFARPFFPVERGLRPEGLHPSRGVAASPFRALCKIPHCCLP